MNAADISMIRSDFLEWSGGFPPESRYQILVYIQYTLHPSFDDGEVFLMLSTWMRRFDTPSA